MLRLKQNIGFDKADGRLWLLPLFGVGIADKRDKPQITDLRCTIAEEIFFEDMFLMSHTDGKNAKSNIDGMLHYLR